MVHLSGRRPGRIRPDLEALRRALSGLGDPQRCFASILVVGTNGKGSTAAMLESILAAHGTSTGLFTSPHLCHVRERIRLRGAEQGLIDRCLGAVEEWPELTYFEAVTAAAFLAFAEAGVEIAVLEAGLGGSWDATRLAGARIAGLTNVGTDHRKWLGDTRREIAADKGRALAAAEVAVLGPGVDEAIRPDLGAERARRAGDIVAARPEGHGLALEIGGRELKIEAPLAGHHQLDNLHLALALADRALDGRLDPNALRRGVAGVHWPGRLSTHIIRGRRVLLEGAHNLEAAEALADHLRQCGTLYSLVFSCLDDKPVEAMAEVLQPVVGRVVVCALDDERAMPLKRLSAAFAGARTAADPFAALAAAADPVLAAGSLRLVGALLQDEAGESV